MHRRQLLILHTVLVITAMLLAWRLVSEWRRANLRYADSSPVKAARAASLLPGPSQRPAPLVNEIVSKNLFSPDRTNTVAAEVNQGPAPPVPIVFGTMNLGGSYEALMAEGGQPPKTSFRRVKSGERMGAYTVIEITDDKVIVEFQGQTTTVDVYQSASSVPRAVARSGPAAPPTVDTSSVPPAQVPQAPQAPSVQSSATPAPAGQPGTAGSPNDPYIRKTVEGNRLRVERQTPFGTQTWYEEIPK